MGQQISLEQFDPAHLRIYKNLLSIQSPGTRVQMIQTLLAGPEYVATFKRAGVYAEILAYVSAVQRGEKPRLLPAERTGITMPSLQGQQQQQQGQQMQQMQQMQVRQNTVIDPYKQVTKAKANEKAMSYFSSCLRVLSLQEEVALTAEALKTAYKKAATKTHPDKGGSEEAFEAVTRAYAYLSEILKRINGGRKELGKVEDPALLTTGRTNESENWKLAEPVRLNAKNLDVTAFNRMFEETRMPDPDDDGYGDWLKGEESKKGSEGPKFGGKFNRDIFHQMFEDEVKKSPKQNNQLTTFRTEAMTLAPNMGVELGRDRPGDFTAAANSGMKYTDLRKAYTTDSTFSGQVQDVQVSNRSFDRYSTERKSAPQPLNDHEQQEVLRAEKEAEQRERQRQYRAANEGVLANDYFERMKRLVITEH